MRYTIGYSDVEKTDENKTTTGYYCFGNFFLPFILLKEFDLMKKNKSYYIPVFKDYKTVQLCSRALSRAYRRDDVAMSSPKKKSKKVRKFYPVKIDSSNFPFKISDTALKEQNLKVDCFNKKTDKELGNFSLYEIISKK